MSTTAAPASAPTDQQRVGDTLLVARALGDPLRWRIVELLAREQLCAGHLAAELDATQPLVSHHLKVLRQAGLLASERYRYWTYYRLRPAALAAVAAQLADLAGQTPSSLACRRPVSAQPPPTAPPRPQGGATMAPNRQLDPISRQAFAAAIASLAEEFRGTFSTETIERYVDESIDRLSGARVVDFIPLFVHRFARERLHALAQAQGSIVKEVPEVLFVCVHNAGRSQIAAALLDHHAKGSVHVRSRPGRRTTPGVGGSVGDRRGGVPGAGAWRHADRLAFAAAIGMKLVGRSPCWPPGRWAPLGGGSTRRCG